MDSATEDILLQKIEELVFDEDQIVTNSILCEKLNISLTEAKLLLEKYVSDQLVSPQKIGVTYLICGKLKTGDYGIQIIEATLLKEKETLFSKIINKVVYSVQKNNNIDFNLIALTENSKTTVLKGSIVSENCSEYLLEVKVLPPLPPPKNFEKQKPASFFKPMPKSQFSGSAETKSTESTVKNDVKIQTKLGKLESFFSQTSQNEIKQKNSSGDKVRNLKRPKTDSLEVKIESQEEIEDTIEKQIESNEKQIESSEKEYSNFRKNGDINFEKTNKNLVTNKTFSNNQPKKQNEDEGKKRKRILIESDSEDDLFGNNEDEKMILEESDEEKVLVTQVQKPSVSVPKNKRRKAIERTYEDEEGYIVTRTEYILVSASEDEEEKHPETTIQAEISKTVVKTELKEEKKTSAGTKGVSKKKVKPVAANQSSIMNFFKKK